MSNTYTVRNIRAVLRFSNACAYGDVVRWANWNKEAAWSRQLERLCLVIRPITAVGVQLKAANSDVLILDRKEDKDK